MLELACVVESVAHPWDKVSRATCRLEGGEAVLLEHHSGLLRLAAGERVRLVVANGTPGLELAYVMNGQVAQIRSGVCTISCGGLLVQLPFVDSPDLDLRLKQRIQVGVSKEA
jgi:hypothetical protein